MSEAKQTLPEILLLEKLEEIDKALPPALWQQMQTDVAMEESLERADKTMLPEVRRRKRMFLRDFVAKAVNMPLKVYPNIAPETERQLYRLHLFCCQRAIHRPEVRHNPFQLGFEALREMKTALIGMMISYRLIDPSCPYSWDRKFFETNIITDKDAEGHTVIKFNHIPPHIVPLAITEELVTDWLIYRAYDNNGIKTLMDYKNNLLTLPDYQRGGTPESEFSRFERKMQEQRNREEKHKNQELDLEFRKTLVRSVAEQTAARMLQTGMSDMEILHQAYNANLNTLVDNRTPQRRSYSDNTSYLPPQTEFNEALTSNYPCNTDYLTDQSRRDAEQIPSVRGSHTLPAPDRQSKQTSETARKKRTPKEPSSSVMDEIIARFLEE